MAEGEWRGRVAGASGGGEWRGGGGRVLLWSGPWSHSNILKDVTFRPVARAQCNGMCRKFLGNPFYVRTSELSLLSNQFETTDALCPVNASRLSALLVNSLASPYVGLCQGLCYARSVHATPGTGLFECGLLVRG